MSQRSMRGRVGVSWLVALAAVMLPVATACSSNTTDTAHAPPQPAPAQSETSPSEPETAEEGDAGWQPAVTDATCAKKKSTASCQACCEKAYPGAPQVIFDAQRSCACRKPNPSCLPECGATFCEGPPPPLSFYEDNQTCFGCFTYATDPGGPDEDCLDVIRGACDADPLCSKLFGCFAKCP